MEQNKQPKSNKPHRVATFEYHDLTRQIYMMLIQSSAIVAAGYVDEKDESLQAKVTAFLKGSTPI